MQESAAKAGFQASPKIRWSGDEGQLRVDLSSLIDCGGTTAIGASASLLDVSAKVASLSNSGRSAWAAGPSLHAPKQPFVAVQTIAAPTYI